MRRLPEKGQKQRSMKQYDVKQKKILCVVKPKLKITGVTFRGYGIQLQHNENEKSVLQETGSGDKKKAEEKQIPVIDRDVLDKYSMLAGVLHSRRNKMKLPGKRSEIRNRKGSRKNIPADRKQTAHMPDQKDHNRGNAAPTAASTAGTCKSGEPYIDRDKMIRRCGIRERNVGVTGVKMQTQKMERILSNEQWDIVTEKAICSIEERQESHRQPAQESGPEQRQGSRRKKTEKDEKQSRKLCFREDKEKKSPDRIKREMLRNYLIKEMVHEEGKTDPDSHFRLLGQLLKYDAGKAAGVIGKLLWKIVRKILFGILMLILGICFSILPFIFFLFVLLSPYSYFMGFYDDDSAIQEEPQYIKNVVQEMYTDFYGQIDAFRDRDWNNQQEYAYGTYSHAQEVIAVYLAKTCSSENFKEMGAQDNYPAYLMIDTVKERAQLKAVFEEFNYYTTWEMELTVKGEDGKDYQVQAEKMIIYCLSVERWKNVHLKELSEPAAKLLESLLKQAGTANEAEGEYPFDGNAVPITDIVIPAGVDENLVYLAGFMRAEAGNQSSQGKVAVGYVILNRAGGASGNIKGVLTAPYQFSCYIPFHTVEKYLQGYAQMTDAQRSQDACWKAAEAVYYGTAENPIGDMRYYCNPKACSAGEEGQWRRIRAKNKSDEILVIGDHVFCKNCW